MDDHGSPKRPVFFALSNSYVFIICPSFYITFTRRGVHIFNLLMLFHYLFSDPTFLIMFSINLRCLFLISINFQFIPRCSHVLSIVFLVFVSRTKFRLSSSVRVYSAFTAISEIRYGKVVKHSSAQKIPYTFISLGRKVTGSERKSRKSIL